MGNCTSLPSVSTRAHAPAGRGDAPARSAAERQRNAAPTRLGRNAPTGAGAPPAGAPLPRTINTRAAHQMPEEVLGHVTGFLPLGEIRAVANLGHVGQGAQGELRVLAAAGAEVATQIDQVADMPAFLRAVGRDAGAGAPDAHALASLRRDMQAGPLAALSRRIVALPVGERQAAGAALVSAMSALHVENHSPHLAALLRIAREPDADHAARSGENLHHILAFHGVDDPEQIERIKTTLANGPARQAALVAENVQDVAHRYGLDTPEDVAFLEVVSASARGVAGLAVLGGANVEQTAIRHGFETPVGILELETRAINGGAGDEVEFGGNVQDVARERGIVSNDGIEMLEAHAMLRAFVAVTEGARIRDVANRVGITTEQGLMEIQALAVGHLMQDDEFGWFRTEPQEIVDRLGLESPEVIAFVTEECARRLAEADAQGQG